ncbi:hypothetical protein VTI74DRAFT_4519 [Chaetomium olivicolor]
MVNFGRFVCVLVPFLLTLASLTAMLLAGLAGITDKGLYMFQINVTDLSISPLSVGKILEGIKAPSIDDLNVPKVSDINIPGVNIKRQQTNSKTGNITAADLGFYNIYDVNIWNYCYTMQNGTRECTKPAFNWATNELNTSTNDLNSLITSTGYNVTLPKEITDAVKAFGTVSKWTQIVFIIAYIALAVELFFGLFANCSRAFSCVTWLIASVATVAVGAAAGLATATSVVVVGAIEGSTKVYGADAHFNKRFLAVVWLGFAFALAAGLFWSFTICCCAPDHSSRRSRSRGGADSEKLMSGGTGYQRLSEPGGYNAGYARQSYGAPQQAQHAGAYEPYSHARV